MRGGLKTLIVALAALLIAVGLAACGGGDSSSSTTTAVDQGQTSSQETSTQSGAKGDEGNGGGGQSGNSSPPASDFTPKHHSDSGGGSAAYQTKGGDNSVQEYGEEAEGEEFAAASAVLHDFLDARAEGNWAATCTYISKAITEGFEKLAVHAKRVKDASCAGILEALANPAAKDLLKVEAEKADVRSLRVEGDRSFVIYTGIKGTVLAMPMANEDGEWKVSSLAGSPLN